MGRTPLALLRAFEAADEVDDLDGWSDALGTGLRRAVHARAVQMLRVHENGRRLESLGGADPLAEAILEAGHATLDEAQLRHIYRSGATVVSLNEVHTTVPEPLAKAMAEAGVQDILGLVAPPGVSVGVFLEKNERLDERGRGTWLSLARYVGVGAALRADPEPVDACLDGDLPAKLRGALAELDRRRHAARKTRSPKDAASALAFLGALADDGFAVVEERRVGRTRRLVAIRPKDPGSRAFRSLDDGERQVLDGLRRGLSLQEIAFELDIAEATVSGRLARLRTKLGIDPRSELVHVASLGSKR
ncbi:MAG: helix-turn-helix transcriptional regulator [Myxococcales bacterium]|nr:helix-turn-helix transcriptional regulator [Myxococcales bacterium]